MKKRMSERTNELHNIYSVKILMYAGSYYYTRSHSYTFIHSINHAMAYRIYGRFKKISKHTTKKWERNKTKKKKKKNKTKEMRKKMYEIERLNLEWIGEKCATYIYVNSSCFSGVMSTKSKREKNQNYTFDCSGKLFHYLQNFPFELCIMVQFCCYFHYSTRCLCLLTDSLSN